MKKPTPAQEGGVSVPGQVLSYECKSFESVEAQHPALSDRQEP
jgi:hypothetical protein